jgi:hypothetical protein
MQAARSMCPTPATTEKGCIVRLFLSLTGACGAGVLVFATAGLAGQPVTQTLNPPPPSYYTCNAVGAGTICTGQPPLESYGPIDTADEGSALVCGTGSDAFDIFDAAVDQVTARRVYDENGDLVRRVLRDDYSFGQFSNPLNGATVPYDQRDTRTDVFAVPGDLASATETTTWESTFHVRGGGAPPLVNSGRTVQAPDGTIESYSGRLDFLKLFVEGDTSVLGPLCTALGA